MDIDNYLTAIGGSLYGEFGWNLSDALASSELRQGLNTALTVGASPRDVWSTSVFIGVGAYGIAHYLPLDGTFFRDSQSVNSEPVVGVISGGISLRYSRLAISLSA